VIVSLFIFVFSEEILKVHISSFLKNCLLSLLLLMGDFFFIMVEVVSLSDRVQPPAVKKRRREDAEGDPQDARQADVLSRTRRGGRGRRWDGGDSGECREDTYYSGSGTGDSGSGNGDAQARGEFREPFKGNNRRMRQRGRGGGGGRGYGGRGGGGGGYRYPN
jgi:hypothetical protein